MTAAFLQSELTSLISDSKRKHAEVRSAAEKSLSELKSISVTSETQLAGDLARKPHFIDPFLLACRSQTVKLASNGAASLQRLVAATAIPRSRLPDVLQAFEDAVPLALEVQLKVLQTLPSLLQLYATDLHGEALARTLSVSADLSSNKLPMVSSTASATFQQLVNAIFTRTAATTRLSNQEVASDAVRDREDALAVFVDLCALLTEEKPEFVRLENLPPPLVLETLESLLATYGSLIFQDQDATKACSQWLVPGICTLIENSTNYGVVVRAFRILFILTTQHSTELTDSLNDPFRIVLKNADRPPNHKWKRVLALEFFRGLCSDFEALREAYTTFDLKGENLDLVSSLMASLVRTASEDPSLIGLGRQSTIPLSRANESGGQDVTSMDVSSTGVAQAGASIGISTEWSSMPTPCLEAFDRVNPVEVPETYIYTLVLGCISAFSDGLSKFIMPLSMPSRRSTKLEDSEADASDGKQVERKPSLPKAPASQKYQHLINPLQRQESSKRSLVETCAHMIESCWPAVLATCSTFLSSALDSHFYHMLIRTVQKLTQVSGVLELNTPRDAFLTTLAKVSVPANVSSMMNTYYGSKLALSPDTDASQDAEEVPLKSPVPNTPRQSIDMSGQSLNVRNLMCLRALLNLGIALGPTLSQAAWTIILQSIEQVEALMSVGPSAKLVQMSTVNAEVAGAQASDSLASEISAVETARRRMVESTKTYGETSFGIVCSSLWQMIEDVIPAQDSIAEQSKNPNGSLRPKASTHKSTRSLSGVWTKASTLEVEVQFVLKFIGRLASVNLHRFRDAASSHIPWNLIVSSLLLLQSNLRLLPHLRLQCGNISDAIIVETCSSVTDGEEENGDLTASVTAVKNGIPALSRQLETIPVQLSGIQGYKEVEVKMAQNLLEALLNVVGSCGESLEEGWTNVFKILSTVVLQHRESQDNDVRGPLFASAFRVVQLITSDFLSILDKASIASILRLLDSFASQQTDLNMTLTSSTLYWNVANLILDRTESVDDFFIDIDALSHNDLKSNLWQYLMQSLVRLCQDSRPEVRNATLQILSKIIDASMSRMTPRNLNSCLKRVLIPLIVIYGDRSRSEDKSWQESASKVLQIVEQISLGHGSLMFSDPDFPETWTDLTQSDHKLLELEDLSLTTTVFDSLSNTIVSLRKSPDSDSFNTNQQLVNRVWSLWSTYHPALIKHAGSNGKAITSHANLLLQLSDWNFEYIAGIDTSVDMIAGSIRKSIFAASHDQYTLDVKKMSQDQYQILSVLKVLQRMLSNKKGHFARFLLILVNDTIERTMLDSQDSKPAANGVRKPTGIAFATACIEEYRVMVQDEAKDMEFWNQLPIKETIEFSAKLSNSKYGPLPFNDQILLWQKASLLGCEVLASLCKHYNEHTHDNDPTLDDLGPSMNLLVKSILQATNLEPMLEELRPSTKTIETDEQFDIARLEAVQSAVHQIFKLQGVHEQEHIKLYVLTLFNHSLVAKPWYNDLTPDLTHAPLKNFISARRGSIRSPILPARRKIYRVSLDCLFNLVSMQAQTPNLPNSKEPTSLISQLAAPYTVLRLGHTLKTFIADQPLRYLEHPHPALQEELHIVLRAFVDLRVADQAFEHTARELLTSNEAAVETDYDVSAVVRKDGKTHLRLMHPLMLKFERVWYKMPRLKKGHAWQDHEHGRGVEECLRRWREAVSEGWGPRFD